MYNKLKSPLRHTLSIAVVVGSGMTIADHPANAQSVLDRPLQTLEFTVLSGDNDLRRGGYAVITQNFNWRYSRICRVSGCGDKKVILRGGIANNKPKTVEMRMHPGTTLRHLSTVELEVNRGGGFGGGISGDNWNVNRVAVVAKFADDPRGRGELIMIENGRPLIRFPGSRWRP